MKKIIALMLCALLALGLCACGSSTPEPEPTPTPAPTAAPAEETPTEAPAEPDPTEAPVEEEADDVAETVALVLSMKDEPVEDLIAIIGEPNSRDYSSSCLVDGQDGQLFYDGFTVYTLFPTGGTETVYDCE